MNNLIIWIIYAPCTYSISSPPYDLYRRRGDSRSPRLTRSLRLRPPTEQHVRTTDPLGIVRLGQVSLVCYTYLVNLPFLYFIVFIYCFVFWLKIMIDCASCCKQNCVLLFRNIYFRNLIPIWRLLRIWTSLLYPTYKRENPFSSARLVNSQSKWCDCRTQAPCCAGHRRPGAGTLSRGRDHIYTT